MTETQMDYGPDLTYHDLGIAPKRPKQDWGDILLSARELAEGAFDIMTNEDFGMYIAWEKMSLEQEKRIKRLLAEYLEKEILERF